MEPKMYLCLRGENVEQFKNCVCEPCYPDAFPSTAISNVLGYLRGTGNVDLACALHCAWVTQGFAMSFIPHDHETPIGNSQFEKCPREMTDAEMADQIASVSAPKADDADSQWIILLMPLVQELIRRLLERRKR